MAKGAKTIARLASFNGANGDNPRCGVVLDSHGNLFGTTEYGGANYQGNVYEIVHGSKTITNLLSFNGKNGSVPEVALALNSLGDLFGTTSSGGADGDGTVFDLTPAPAGVLTSVSFNGVDGSAPTGAVSLDSSGNLFGAASAGGAAGFGMAFEVARGAKGIAVVATFS